MQALVKEGPGPGFAIREVEDPRPGETDVIVAVKAVGICGSDVPIFEGVRQVPLPLIPGHEFAGVVVETGSQVTQFQRGDRVTAGLIIGCGECNFCRLGLENLCPNLKEIGFDVDGAFAQYVRVPERNLHLLPNPLTFEEGASLDPVASAYRPVKLAEPHPGETVAVFGPGPIGLYAVQVARAFGAGKLIAVGTRDDRLRKARELGASHTVNIRQENLTEAVRDITGGRLVDVAIEATGTSQVLPEIFSVVRKGGRISLAGISHDTVTTTPMPVVRRELKILGSFCYTRDDFRNSMALIALRRVKTDPIITHRLPLGQAQDAWRLIKERSALKVILQPATVKGGVGWR